MGPAVPDAVSGKIEGFRPARGGSRELLRDNGSPTARMGTVAVVADPSPLPLPPDRWEHPGDSDGDGLLDEFEAAMGLDPRKACSFPDGVPDENRLDSKGRTMWEAQEDSLRQKRSGSP